MLSRLCLLTLLALCSNLQRLAREHFAAVQALIGELQAGTRKGKSR
jgi:hypothetical protein